VIEENGRRKDVLPTPLSGIRDDDDDERRTLYLISEILSRENLKKCLF
jgi:hypothetical protein